MVESESFHKVLDHAISFFLIVPHLEVLHRSHLFEGIHMSQPVFTNFPFLQFLKPGKILLMIKFHLFPFTELFLKHFDFVSKAFDDFVLIEF